MQRITRLFIFMVMDFEMINVSSASALMSVHFIALTLYRLLLEDGEGGGGSTQAKDMTLCKCLGSACGCDLWYLAVVCTFNMQCDDSKGQL